MRNTRYAVLLVQMFILLSCGDKKNDATISSETKKSDGSITLTEEQFTSNAMRLGSMEEKLFPVTIATTGMIDVPPENRAVVSATMGGYIQKTPLLIGDAVKKGQLLVTLENPAFVTLQQNYMEVYQQLAYLQAEYERQQTLQKENITSQKSFLKAESDFKTANARYNGLKKRLQMLNISPDQVVLGDITSTVAIYAPISGSITEMHVTKGTYVSPASPILEIIDNAHIHLELSVFEKDIMKIKKGQPIHFSIPEASVATFEAEVYLIGTAIGANRTIKVHGHLKEEGETFLTGMFVNADIVTENTKADALPSTAVVEREGSFYVLRKLANNTTDYGFEPIEVQPGKIAGGYTEIKRTALFSASDTFVTKGAFDILSE